MEKYSYNQNSDKTIWVDLDNSPHVPFFAPIIARLEAEGYNIKISARNYSQTVSLANLYGLKHTAIGKHHGKNKFIKVIGLLYRSIQLLPFAIKSKSHIAISHGSRSQMIVAFLLRIPIVMFLDYEFIQTIPFVKPKMIFLPNIISTGRLKSLASKIVSYPGIKEDIYVPGFKPDPSIKKVFEMNNDTITVVLRPPAHEAHYHNAESEEIFEKVIDLLTSIDSVQTVLLPRDDRQKASIESTYKEHFVSKKLKIPTDVVDGLQLMWFSDLVISGGGTMNREAAALGVPVYSIFKGKIGDVDKYLSESKRLILIENVADIKKKLVIVKRDKNNDIRNVNSLALQSIVNNLESFVHEVYNSGNTNKAKTDNDRELSPGRK